jgi:serine protease Do
MLPSSLFTRGPELLRSFREVVTTARECTVAFTQRGEIVVLGTVVGADGWVVTKASELESAREQPGSTSPLRCRLSDGRHVSFEEVGVDPVHDLVLLKVDADRLKPVTWGDAAGLQLGNWLVSSGTGPSPVSVGVVSVLARKLSGSPGYMGIAGSETAEGPVIVDVQRGSGAARAGLRTGDLITHIGDEPVTVFADVSRTVQQHRPGSMIDVTVRRGETAEKVTVRLGVHPEAVSGGSNRLTGPLSMRRDNFPSVIQHDSVLHPAECGGPVVSLRGQVIGINIARAERTASYLLPADVVRRVIDELMP